MLEEEENSEAPIISEDDAAVLQEAKDCYAVDKPHWDKIYDKGRDDLTFLSDEEAAQWPEKEYNNRFKTGRPALTVDQLSQFTHQVANGIRMNTPSINPIPAGGKSTVVKAKVIKGLIKRIEYVSGADEVYDTGSTFAVKCGIGYATIDHDYVDPKEGFDQQLLIKKVINPFVIYPDCTSVESDGSDYNHAIILERMKVTKFRSEFPEADISSFEDEGTQRTNYGDDDEVTIAHFYIKRFEESEIQGVSRTGKKLSRVVKIPKIYRYKLSGTEVLLSTTFPGEYVPVVPFYGEEAWKDGERNLHSLIRKSKQAQFMYNLMASVETEILLKQPIAPVMVPAGAIENYKEDWQNPSKASALRYDQFDKDGNPLNPPSRLQPVMMPAGVVNARHESVDDIKATMGLYSNNLGQQGQEVSGKAINARKVQGDVATYHFGDNTVRSITQIGRILVCAIPEIYDMERAIDIIDDEDKPQIVGINGHLVDDQKESHDLTDGKYDVRVITGSSYTTTRQESADFYQEVVKTSPELMKVCGDLLFENMDIAGAQKMAARMKKLIDPKLLEGEDGGEDTDPQVLMLKQQLQQAQGMLQQAAAQIQQLTQQVQDKNAGAQLKRETDQEKNQIEMMKVQLQKQGQQMDFLIKMLGLQVQADRNDITEQNNAGNLALKANAQHVDNLLQATQTFAEALAPTELPQAGNPAANNGAGNQSGVLNNG